MAKNVFRLSSFSIRAVTALDAVGPWDLLSRIPDVELRFVGKETGPVATEGGALLVGATRAIAETPAPDLVLVPGGATSPGQMVVDEVLDWLRKVHQTTMWTLYRGIDPGSGGNPERPDRDDPLV